MICRGVLSAVEDRPQLPHQWERWLAAADLSVIKTERVAAVPGTPEYVAETVASCQEAR